MSVAKKTIFALKWVSALQAYTFVSRLVINIILAKLLVPDDFGLVAIVVIFTEILTAIADLGFNAAIIQKKEISTKDINTAFILNLTLSVFLTVTIFFSAGFIASFYKDTRLVELVQLLSFIIIVRAASSVQIALCDRNLDFKKVVVISGIAITISSIVKIILAYLNFQAKSIVIGELINHSIIALLFWTTTKWKPNLLEFSTKSFKKLFSFGSNIMLTNTISLLSQKVDILVIGKLITAFYVGIYSFSFMISTVVVGFINSVVSRVIFPGFSRIQDNNNEMKKLYLYAVKFISSVSVPASVGLFFIAPEFVNIFLKKEWKDAIDVIQILSIYGISNSLGGILWGQVLKAKGKSKKVLNLTIIRLIALVIFIYIGSKWGIIGIAISVTIYGWIFRFVYQHIINKIIDISMFDYIKSLKNASMATFFMVTTLSLIRYIKYTLQLNDLLIFVTIILFGIISYGIAYKLLFKDDVNKIISTLKGK